MAVHYKEDLIMNIHKVDQKPVAKQLYELKCLHSTQILMGEARRARETYRDFAKLAVENFETAVNVPSPVQGKINLFSFYGLNCIKYMIYRLFTRKSPEEKQFKQMVKEHKLNRMF